MSTAKTNPISGRQLYQKRAIKKALKKEPYKRGVPLEFKEPERYEL